MSMEVYQTGGSGREYTKSTGSDNYTGKCIFSYYINLLKDKLLSNKKSKVWG